MKVYVEKDGSQWGFGSVIFRNVESERPETDSKWMT